MKKLCEELAKLIKEWSTTLSAQELQAKGKAQRGKDEEVDACHILWMLEEIPKIYEEYDDWERRPVEALEKAHRWLGFVQGWVWATGIVSINELRELTRKYCD